VKQTSLLPLTKFVLVVSTVVQVIMALAALLVPDLTRTLLSPSADSPIIGIQYVGGFYLAGAVTAAFAFQQDKWIAARTYLAGAFVLIAAFTLITLAGLFTIPGLNPISWVYALLSFIFLPLVAIVWRQESARL